MVNAGASVKRQQIPRLLRVGLQLVCMQMSGLQPTEELRTLLMIMADEDGRPESTMTQQKGGVSGTLVDKAATYDSSSEFCATGDGGRVPLPDMLTYMADMLAELRSIAEKNNWQTLSGLLALSHAEAMTRHDEILPRRAASKHDR